MTGCWPTGWSSCVGNLGHVHHGGCSLHSDACRAVAEQSAACEAAQQTALEASAEAAAIQAAAKARMAEVSGIERRAKEDVACAQAKARVQVQQMHGKLQQLSKRQQEIQTLLRARSDTDPAYSPGQDCYAADECHPCLMAPGKLHSQ